MIGGQLEVVQMKVCRTQGRSSMRGGVEGAMSDKGWRDQP